MASLLNFATATRAYPLMSPADLRTNRSTRSGDWTQGFTRKFRSDLLQELPDRRRQPVVVDGRDRAPLPPVAARLELPQVPAVVRVVEGDDAFRPAPVALHPELPARGRAVQHVRELLGVTEPHPLPLE